MDVGTPVVEKRADPSHILEILWDEYRRSEMGESITDGEVLKKLRQSYFTGAWTMHRLFVRTNQLEDRAAVELLNAVCGEIENVIKTLRKKPGVIV